MLVKFAHWELTDADPDMPCGAPQLDIPASQNWSNVQAIGNFDYW